MTERKMATIRVIDAIDPIPDADSIEVCTVGGWKVVSQKGLYKPGDMVVYCEIDSFIPHDVAPFLTKPDHFPKNYNGVDGERLKTIKLRGQISQGLLLPLDLLPYVEGWSEGADVSDTLGITKWEAPVSAQLAGISKGSFPHFIRKTDQERIQNLSRDLDTWKKLNAKWETTEKLDGSSMTAYVHEGEFGVCSRNLNLKETEDNAFWRAAREYELEISIRHLMERCSYLSGGLALQGELVGPGIQKNPYGLKEIKFFLFDMWSINSQSHLPPVLRTEFAKEVGIPHVPILEPLQMDSNTTMVGLLEKSNNFNSILNPSARAEGLVYKNFITGQSFKVISNLYLIKTGN